MIINLNHVQVFSLDSCKIKTTHHLYSLIPYFLIPSFIICDGINDLSEEQIKKNKGIDKPSRPVNAHLIRL